MALKEEDLVLIINFHKKPGRSQNSFNIYVDYSIFSELFLLVLELLLPFSVRSFSLNHSVLCDWFEPLLEGTKTHKDATKYKMMKASDNMHFTPAKVIITGLMLRQEGSDSADGRIFHLDEADLRNIDRYIGLTVDMMKAEEKEERALKKKAAGSKKQDAGGVQEEVVAGAGGASRSRGKSSKTVFG